MANPNPIPNYDEIAQRPKLPNGNPNPNAYRVADTWLQYFAQQSQDISSSSRRLVLPILNDQNASIGATSLSGDQLPAGMYRVTWFVHITTPGAVSGTVIVTTAFTHDGASRSFVGDTVDQAVNRVGSGSDSFLIDGGSPITYATTYASNAAGQMRYTLAVWLEQAGQV